MFEYFNNNILCVQANWLVESNILTMSNYSQLVSRGHLQKVTTGGNGRKALIKFDNMRTDIKNKVIDLVGNPYEKLTTITFVDYIEDDTKAIEFFQAYTLEDGKALPEKNITEYCINAAILNACNVIANSKLAQRKALAGKRVNVWEKLADAIQNLPKHTYPHSLPSNHRRLKDKFKQYLNGSYEVLIHGGFLNSNSEKINDDAKSFVLARWCDRVKKVTGYVQLLEEYNQEAVYNGWKVLKSEQSLINFLTDPKIEPLWYGYRFGELQAKEKYSFQFKTVMPSMRDSLWYSDGTKLNLYYQDENGKMQTMQVYEVMDSFSEVFLGYHISKTEDYEAQYNAYKMAIKTAGHRPYQITYDNQGGHKKLESGNFLNKIAQLSVKTQPYNGKSKTIESAFGRFQTQILAKHWFFTGQNITAKKIGSKANMEFILANQSNLPTLKEVKEIYEKARQEWNSSSHYKTGKPRIDMYYESFNEKAPEITPFQMVDFFWIERTKPVTCTASGISFKEKGVQYDYVVYDKNRELNLVWHRKNVDKKFVIKFDPDDMSLVFLYEKTPLGLRFVCEAETKPVIHRGKQEQEDNEMEFISGVIKQNKELRIKVRDEAEENLAKHKMRAEDYGLRNPNIKGVEKQKRVKKEKTDIGAYQKEVSNVVLTNEDTSIYDQY